MPKNALLFVVFLLGLLAVGWIGAGYVGSNLLGVGVTMMIGACYLAGALELHRYRHASATLTRAVADAGSAVSDLGDWLGRLHPSLRNAVRLRIEGERVPLPGPALTPYLVGLLVLLGMLGTLMGMMATLRGTGLALESASDLAAIRGSLGAPVKGLAFAFGTSIAGVASSAMLGLLSALCRRERLQAVQQLDVEVATTLRPHSQAWRRDEAFQLLQQQTALMPTLVDRLQSMMTSLEQHNLTASERLATQQQEFHARAEASHERLAASLEQTLKTGVSDNAQAVVAALQPVVTTTMAGLARETASLHTQVSQAVQQQLDGLSTGIETVTSAVAEHWTAAVAEQRQANNTLVADLGGTLARQQTLNEQLAARNEQALATAATNFDDRAGALVHVLQQAHAQLQTQMESRDQHRLAQWTDAFGVMVEERTRLLGSLETLLNAVNHASTEQSTAAAHVSAGAVEVASLGDAFGAAVQVFGTSTDALAERLQHIETALDKSMSRSDEQLAYYVAQAREVVDLSLLSQKQIIGELQHLATSRTAAEA
ncbi:MULTISPECIES: DUF802 domain-containing protein [unclassified Lysobacter]